MNLKDAHVHAFTENLDLALQGTMFSQFSFLLLFLVLLPQCAAQSQSRSVFNLFLENIKIVLKNDRERHEGIHA